MKKKFLNFKLVLVLTIGLTQYSNAQNVGISATGSTPDNSAMLDVSATDKGLLIPRVTLQSTVDAATILTPATSLLVYNTTAAGSGSTAVVPGFYYQSSSPATPLWVPFGGGASKFTVPFSAWRYSIIDASPSPMGGANSNGDNNIDYGNPAVSAPNNVKYSSDAIFTAQSNCTFNGLNGWINESFASGATVTVSLYRYRPTSGGTPPMGSLVGSTTVTCASSSNTYSFTIAPPATPFTAQQGDIFIVYASQPGSAANFIFSGSMEFINN